MSIGDALMWRYYELLSDLPQSEIDARHKQVESGELHPKKAKSMLAEELVARYHSAEQARAELLWFEENIGKKDALPDDIASHELATEGGGLELYKILVQVGFATSNGEARRLIKQGAVRLDGDKHDDAAERVGAGEYVLRTGKKRFAKIVLQ
jgi:tyrosyl-tRNA synthetase